jgi:predicted RNA-binding Zn-ribbon protein involved in translation (DUF1610 family)
MGKRVDLFECPTCGILAMYKPGEFPAHWRCSNCGGIVEEPKTVLVELPIAED